MKLQLIYSPNQKKAGLSGVLDTVVPPSGVLYIAACILQEFPDIEIKVTDGFLKGWNKTLNEFDDFAPDIVFISYLTTCAVSAYSLAQYIKIKAPGTIMVFGGPHATSFPIEPFEKGQADYVGVGEGEVTSVELIRAIKQGDADLSHINGLAWKNGDEVIINKTRCFIPDINSIPFPARGLVNLGEYRGWFVGKPYLTASILTARGCSFNCAYCSNAVWKGSTPWLRTRSPENIANEMEALKAMGVHEVFDYTDEFNNDMDNAMNICREIIKRKLNMYWTCMLRGSPVTEELVSLMAQAGCEYVSIGIESGNQRTLDGIGKKVRVEDVIKACELLQKHKIKIIGLFMLFNVWEERGQLAFEGIRETEDNIKFVEMLLDKGLINFIFTAVTTPLPGSRLYDIARKYDLIKEEYKNNWEGWQTEETFIMKLPGVDEKDATVLYNKLTAIRNMAFYKYFSKEGWKFSGNNLWEYYKEKALEGKYV